MDANYRELLLGAGSNFERRLSPVFKHSPLETVMEPWHNLTTLDMEASHAPDILFNLDRLSPLVGLPLPSADASYIPTPDSYYDEIHAYEVLEHIGAQGDFRTFFIHFNEFWRILKPGGYLCATVPSWSSVWAWGDPGHTRVINAGTLVFLSQSEYVKQVGRTAMSDYRAYYHGDFETVWAAEMGEQFMFILKAIK